MPEDIPESHGWTLHTLEKYLSSRISAVELMQDEREARGQERISATKERIDKFEDYTDKRFHGVNEFRLALDDQTKNNISRHEYAAQHQGLIDKVDGVIQRVISLDSGIKGKHDGFGVIGATLIGTVTVINVVIAAIAYLHK